MPEAEPREIRLARWEARVSRIWRWEFWPPWLFYLPVAPYVCWLAARHGGFRTITASNPGIPQGGFVGESKYEILRKLPQRWVAPFALLAPAEQAERLARLTAMHSENGWALPFILKPDCGERGAGLRLIRSWEDASAAIRAMPGPLLVQRFHPGPYEAGVFYVRPPGAPHGRIFSITDKHFPRIEGDGRSSVRSLIWRHPRYRMQAGRFLARLNGRADMAPADGQTLQLATAGNHCQGTMFRDGAHLITPALERRIDEIARAFEGFFFGRFDIRYTDVERFKAGEDLTIIELNGATSESTNIYDPSWPLWRAYGVLYRQWRLLFEIGALNRRAGSPATPTRELLHVLRRHYRERRAPELAD